MSPKSNRPIISKEPSKYTADILGAVFHSRSSKDWPSQIQGVKRIDMVKSEKFRTLNLVAVLRLKFKRFIVSHRSHSNFPHKIVMVSKLSK